LRRLGEVARGIERHRGPDPYPRPTGPNLEELRRRRDEIERVALRHGGTMLRVFGSVTCGDAGPNSDLDVLVDMEDRQGLLEQTAPQNELEDLLG
jgi:predicted nucleotidyltransferase